MKTYIVYVEGVEVGTIKAGSHNAAEKKARKRWAPTAEKVRNFMSVNPFMTKERALERLTYNVSVAYTEL